MANQNAASAAQQNKAAGSSKSWSGTNKALSVKFMVKNQMNRNLSNAVKKIRSSMKTEE